MLKKELGSGDGQAPASFLASRKSRILFSSSLQSQAQLSLGNSCPSPSASCCSLSTLWALKDAFMETKKKKTQKPRLPNPSGSADGSRSREVHTSLLSHTLSISEAPRPSGRSTFGPVGSLTVLRYRIVQQGHGNINV